MLISTNRIHQGLDGNHVVDQIFDVFFISWTGVSEPRISVTGKELPTARYVSAINHRDFGFHDHAVTVYLPAWGQLIDHDMTQGAESKGNCYTHSKLYNLCYFYSSDNGQRAETWKSHFSFP